MAPGVYRCGGQRGPSNLSLVPSAPEAEQTRRPQAQSPETLCAHLDHLHLTFPLAPLSSTPCPHLPAPLGCRAEEVSLFSCPEKVPVSQLPAQGGGTSWLLRICDHSLALGLPSPCWDHSPGGKLSDGCQPLPLRGVLLCSKH